MPLLPAAPGLRHQLVVGALLGARTYAGGGTVEVSVRRTLTFASVAWVLAVGVAGIFIGVPIATCVSAGGMCSSIDEQIRQGYWWWPWLPMIAGPIAMAMWSWARSRTRQR